VITVDDFGGGATGTYFLTDVPAGTTGLSAKTAWHLRTKLTGLSLDGDGQLTGADFTGTEELLGGDLDDSNAVNILDYSILSANWVGGNPVADIDGDGGVNTGDYDIMVGNWFQIGDDE
jgi:hypothetical protein